MHSHIFTKSPPSATRRGCARFVDLHFVISARLTPVRRCAIDAVVLHALICTFYHRESVETIKMDASGDFFFFPLRCIDLPALLSTGGSPSVWGLCRLDEEGKCFFFSLPTLQTHSVLSVHCGTWREWDLNLFNPPSHRPSDVASFPGFDAQDQVGFSYLLKPQVKTKYLMYPLRSFSKCTYL